MLLSDILKKDNNNIDLIRIIAAVMVIYGHSYEISPEIGKGDLLRSLLGFDYSGSLAVKIFFFISGLVVANSLFKKMDVKEYIVSRFFRIWPTLMAAIIISYFFSYLFTSLTGKEFLKSVPFINYIVSSFFLNFTWSFPGVFNDNTINTFNGSLWSIVYEVGCYIVLLSISSIFGYKRIFINAICLLVIFDSVFGVIGVFNEALSRDEVKYLPAIFALGVMFSANKDIIKINIGTSAFLVLLCTVLYSQQSTIYIITFYITLMYSIIYLSANKYFILLKPKYDISYGVYLYGFPVQQISFYLLKETGVGIVTNQIVSIALSLLLGLASWLLIEKRFINYGRLFISRLSPKMSEAI